MANASVNWQNRIINIMFEWHYLGKEWYDDENTQYIEPHSVFDLKLDKNFEGAEEAGRVLKEIE